MDSKVILKTHLSVHHTFSPTGRCLGAEAPCGWQVTIGGGLRDKEGAGKAQGRSGKGGSSALVISLLKYREKGKIHSEL